MSICRQNREKKYVLLLLLVLICFSAFIKKSNAQNIPENTRQEINKYRQLIIQYQETGNKTLEAQYHNRIATLYWQYGLFAKAINHFNESLKINQSINNINALQFIHGQLGLVYSELENNNTAISQFNKSYEFAKQLDNKPEIISQLLNLARVYNHSGNYQISIEKAELALEKALGITHLHFTRTAYGILSENHKLLGNEQKSLEYFNLYSTFDKKIRREKEKKLEETTEKAIAEKIAKENELELKSRLIKEIEDSLQRIGKIILEDKNYIELLEDQKKKKELELEKKDIKSKHDVLVRKVLIGGIVISFLLVGLIFFGYHEKHKANKKLSAQYEEISFQKAMIEETSDRLGNALDEIYNQNVQISSSIDYAKNIQEAILPDKKNLHNYLPESFIVFHPCNVVSGDFYWFKSFLQGGAKKFIIAAVDCTGHGVPGAFMSMIGINLLNEIINRHFIQKNIPVHANLIVEELRKEIRTALNQETTNNTDGMDLALCIVDHQNKELEFSGAYNPLIYIQNGQLHVIKGDKVPVGGYQGRLDQHFHLHKVSFKQETCFYIFSDGYADQIGGPKNKKFSSRRLRESLLQIHSYSMEEQRSKLESQFLKWKGDDQPQTDDIIMIGFRLNSNFE